MGYYEKSVVPIIESNYNNFTNLEKTIADYFIANQEKEDFSAKAISKKLYISEASLSRFAQKCGFKGYREFLYQYEQTFSSVKEPIDSKTRDVLSTYQELLNKTYSLLDEQQIARVSTYLNQAKRVFVCGKGSSGLVANEIQLRLMRLGLDIVSIVDSDIMRMQAVLCDEDSLVIAFSLSGEKKGMLYFLTEAHQRGAKTILLTANNRESFSTFCDEVILVPSLAYLNRGIKVSPQFPLLVMMDIVFSEYLGYDKSKKESLHDTTIRALEEENKQVKDYPV